MTGGGGRFGKGSKRVFEKGEEKLDKTGVEKEETEYGHYRAQEWS